MKKVITVIAVIHVFLSALFDVGFAPAEDLNLDFNPECVYAKLGVIVDFDFTEDLVFVSDWNGDIWSFHGIEDWAIWEYVSMVFHDNGTPMNIYDDMILSVHYERVDLVQVQVLNSIRNAYP